MQLPASPDKPVRLEFVQDRRGVILDIGAVMLPGHANKRRAEVTVDIDAGNTITVEVDDTTLRERRRFQLNNQYAMPAPHLTAQYSNPLELLSAGYTLYPVQPMDTPVASPSSAVRLDTFVQSELAALGTLIADAERKGSSDPATGGTYSSYYRHRAAIHEIRKDLVAAALDYISSFRFGRPAASAELSRVLPLIKPADERIAAALETGLSALDPQRSWFYAKDLESLATVLDNNGYKRSGVHCRQIAAAAARLESESGG